MEDLTAATSPSLSRAIPVYKAGPHEHEIFPSNAMTERHDRDGLGWRFTGVDDWTTELIFETFIGLGIALDEPRFRELARQYASIEDLAKSWNDHFRADDLWSDFPFIAAQTLWERLAPDIEAPEIIAKSLETCEALLDGGSRDVGEILAPLKVFTDHLVSYPQEEIPGRFEKVQRCMITDILWICSQAITVFGDEFPAEATEAVRVVQIACPQGSALLLGDLALIALRAGKIDEARALLDDQLRLEPDAPETYVSAATFAHRVGEHQSAIDNAVKALNLEKDPKYWDLFYTQFGKMFIGHGRSEDLDAVDARIRRPQEPPRPGAISHTPIHINRIGRNDPCPCGSGKKYKKCCG